MGFPRPSHWSASSKYHIALGSVCLVSECVSDQCGGVGVCRDCHCEAEYEKRGKCLSLHVSQESLELTPLTACSHSTLIHASVVLVPILGVTWALGFLVVGGGVYATVVEWLFFVFTTLQGVAIFFAHCVINREVRVPLSTEL